MKPEPLKNKKIRSFLKNSKEQVKSDGYYRNYFNFVDIKSAVEWLKEEIPLVLACTIEKKLEKLDIDNLLLIVDKAFEDVIKKKEVKND